MEYSNMKTEELFKELQEKRERLRIIRFDVAGSKIKNVKEIRELKRNIARILTAQNHE